jgi:hypothetical protein
MYSSLICVNQFRAFLSIAVGYFKAQIEPFFFFFFEPYLMLVNPATIRKYIKVVQLSMSFQNVHGITGTGKVQVRVMANNSCRYYI